MMMGIWTDGRSETLGWCWAMNCRHINLILIRGRSWFWSDTPLIVCGEVVQELGGGSIQQKYFIPLATDCLYNLNLLIWEVIQLVDHVIYLAVSDFYLPLDEGLFLRAFGMWQVLVHLEHGVINIHIWVWFIILIASEESRVWDWASYQITLWSMKFLVGMMMGF